MDNIGRRIQNFRIKNGLSQEALAEKLGVTRQSVSKWELEQALPEVDKIAAMSRLFSIKADDLLFDNDELFSKPNEKLLHLGSVYLITKHFSKSIDFYEKLLSMRVSTINPDKFAEFLFDKKCIAIMNEACLHGRDYSGGGDYKFVLNFWADSLQPEYERVKSLAVGKVTEIKQAHPQYWYFHLYDPDNNVIEITGGYDADING